MDDQIKKKLSKLEPRIRKTIIEAFELVLDSVSLLYDEATHDAKTGLYNNRFFDQILEMEIDKAQRGQEELSVAVWDIDYFKKLNDSYGHIKADELLKRLATIFKKSVRKSDVPSRFGGDEIMILLPETTPAHAKGFAERVRKLIANDPLLKKHKVTLSGGLTTFDPKKDTKKSFLSRADKALYTSKENGRNRVTFL